MSNITIRPPAAKDEAALGTFLEAIPEADRRFLPEDTSDSRARTPARSPTSVGLVAAMPGTGWPSHVANIEVIVAVSHRHRGLGRTLARRILVVAFELGCAQVSVEVVAEQGVGVAMFAELGFDPEALLRDFMRDSDGEFHDLIVLTHRADDHAEILATAGLNRSGS